MTQLLADGANVNSTDLSGDTALIIASRDDKADNVDFILAHGANVNRPEMAIKSPLISR